MILTWVHSCPAGMRSHTYIHTYIHACIHTYWFSRGYTHALQGRDRMHTYIHTCMHAYIMILTWVYSCLAGTRSHTHTHTYIHTYIHTYMHRYMRNDSHVGILMPCRDEIASVAFNTYSDATGMWSNKPLSVIDGYSKLKPKNILVWALNKCKRHRPAWVVAICTPSRNSGYEKLYDELRALLQKVMREDTTPYMSAVTTHFHRACWWVWVSATGTSSLWAAFTTSAISYACPCSWCSMPGSATWIFIGFWVLGMPVRGAPCLLAAWCALFPP